ncbi:hypothetical protein ACFQI7_02790 [Paenibacillus allorhizosphaerae]|uniref:Uncharacterized protein n=1 Tax=Paenibacillus allorhizosphaerae TaxID=2849866 RepID=A0ABM8VB51_9BACL|nr:hypothetical protein [Paenibacillus allorhizosphaerae]CAG7618466.1 hypothetical protein PAECIP111802_00520 [Paenibacillus allorhizosphaerae]
MKKLAFTTAALMAVISVSSVVPANAAAKEVTVRLPAPPIVYKDIVYVPMTWNNGVRLNLSVEWNEEEGLSISRGLKGAYVPTYEPPAPESNDMNRNYKATVADYPIMVNGHTIVNANEPYPILSFRDITYFPLTWRFAHDEFDWTTDWNPEDGFGLIAGGHGNLMSRISLDDDNALYIGTNIYGTLRINKSLQGRWNRSREIMKRWRMQ